MTTLATDLRREARTILQPGDSLGRYAGVIVVDSGGNGDYTSLRQAITEAENGSVIFMFGDQIDTGPRLIFNKKLTLIGTGISQNIGLSMGPNIANLLDVYNCHLSGYVGHGTSQVKVRLTNVVADHLEAIAGNWVITNCDIGILTDLGAGTVVAVGSRFNSISSEDIIVSPSLQLQNCKVNGLALWSYDENFWTNSTFAGCVIDNCTVHGPTWQNARFYHCIFANPPTNLMFAPGNYSNIVNGVTWPAP